MAFNDFGRLKVIVATPWDISTFTPGFIVSFCRERKGKVEVRSEGGQIAPRVGPNKASSDACYCTDTLVASWPQVGWETSPVCRPERGDNIIISERHDADIYLREGRDSKRPLLGASFAPTTIMANILPAHDFRQLLSKRVYGTLFKLGSDAFGFSCIFRPCNIVAHWHGVTHVRSATHPIYYYDTSTYQT